MAWHFFKSKKKHDYSRWPRLWGHSCFVWLEGPMVSYLGTTIYDWLFTKCFHEKLQYVPKGRTSSAAFTSGRENFFPLLMLSKWYCTKYLLLDPSLVCEVCVASRTLGISYFWGSLTTGFCRIGVAASHRTFKFLETYSKYSVSMGQSWKLLVGNSVIFLEMERDFPSKNVYIFVGCFLCNVLNWFWKCPKSNRKYFYLCMWQVLVKLIFSSFSVCLFCPWVLRCFYLLHDKV